MAGRKLSANQKESIWKMVVQIAIFIDGGADAVQDFVKDESGALWRFDNNEKIIIERGVEKIVAIAEQEGSEE